MEKNLLLCRLHKGRKEEENKKISAWRIGKKAMQKRKKQNSRAEMREGSRAMGEPCFYFFTGTANADRLKKVEKR